MGCVQSVKEDTFEDRNNVEAQNNDKNSQQPAAADDESITTKAKQQRRRLSVAPQQVGDITKHFVAHHPSSSSHEEKSEIHEKSHSNSGLPMENYDFEENATLTQVEKQGKGKVRHACHSKTGFVPYNRNKVNQDRFIIKYAIGDDPTVNLFGVMDGHGEFGHLVAAFITQSLPVFLAKHFAFNDDNKYKRPHESIKNAVQDLCHQLQASSGINLAFSGSTLVFAVEITEVIQNKGEDNHDENSKPSSPSDPTLIRRLYVGNVGDSRCVLARQKADGSIQAIPLTNDHKPDVESERKRIIESGGRVATLPGPSDGDNGPLRVWLAQIDVPGLAMSRSIGDEVSQTVGVISEPEITELIITNTLEQSNSVADPFADLFIVFASDGVWEFLPNQDVVDFISSFLPNQKGPSHPQKAAYLQHKQQHKSKHKPYYLQEASEGLVFISDQKWRTEEEVVDDITCVIVQFHPLKN